MADNILLEALKEIAIGKWSDWKIIDIATEAIKKWEDSSGKETGIPTEAIKFLRETHIIWKQVWEKDLIEKALKMAYNEGRQSVPPYKEGIELGEDDKVYKEPPYKEEVDKEKTK